MDDNATKAVSKIGIRRRRTIQYSAIYVCFDFIAAPTRWSYARVYMIEDRSQYENPVHIVPVSVIDHRIWRRGNSNGGKSTTHSRQPIL